MIQNKYSLVLSLLILILFIHTTIQAQTNEIQSILYIKPETITVKPGESFNVTIYFEPAQPVKAFEFDLDFDSSLLIANNVNKGDIFKNYTTWFNSGTIDNTKGYIDNIYGLITEDKNVSDPGSLATITFTAKNIKKTTDLILNDTGISNETDYIKTIVYNGTVKIGTSDDDSDDDSTEPLNNPPKNPEKPSGITYGFTNITYNFATTTSDPDDDKIEYLFDWGDDTYEIWIGSFDSNEVFSYGHSWKKPGVFEVKVKARDTLNDQSSWSSSLIVAIENQEENQNNQTENNKPIADFTYKPDNPTNQDIIQFTDMSIDIDGNITKWLWDFGDGSTSELQNPTHKYQKNNSYIITLTVWDNNDSINISQKEILILEKTVKTDEKEQSETPGFSLIAIISAIIIILFYRKKLS